MLIRSSPHCLINDTVSWILEVPTLRGLEGGRTQDISHDCQKCLQYNCSSEEIVFDAISDGANKE